MLNATFIYFFSDMHRLYFNCNSFGFYVLNCKISIFVVVIIRIAIVIGFVLVNNKIVECIHWGCYYG